ncbi:MAG TPA: VanW family protein [Candidatus Limnocylindrales bacterium]|nr:VanW family protein [Candidatus Limnocylindrales bacterium]
MDVTGDLGLLDPTGQGGAFGRAPRVIGLALLGLLVALAAAGIAVAAFLLGLSIVYADRALPGVQVAGQSVAGLDRAQATALLRTKLAPLGQGSLVVQLGDRTVSARLSELERDYGVEAMVDAALAYGHQGSIAQRAADELGGLTRGVDVAASAIYDSASVRAWVLHVAGTLDASPVDAVAAAPAKNSTSFRVTPGTLGTVVDSDRLLKQVQQALLAPRPGDIVLRLPLDRPVPAVTTDDAQAAVDAAMAMTAQPLKVKAQDKQWTIPVATQRSWITFASAAAGTYGPDIDLDALRATLAPYASSLAKPAENASWTTSGNKVTGVIPAKQGRALDTLASATAISAALRSDSGSSVPINLLVKPVQPAVTTAMAEAEAPHMQVLGQWSTTYTVYIENYYGKNIQIPVTQIDGTVVAAGATFDFWKTVVVSAALGYGPGGEIVNGHSHLTGALGGGICSCSTTLFNAAMRAGLKMGQRTNHYYYITRYPVGLDATVYKDQWSTVNMTFTNDMANAILIRGINTVHPGWAVATFKIFGVSDGRKVSISAPVVKNKKAAGCCIYQDTSSLPKGTTQQVEYPADGFDSWVTVTVRKADGNLLSNRTYYSHYAVVDGTFLRGTG